MSEVWHGPFTFSPKGGEPGVWNEGLWTIRILDEPDDSPDISYLGEFSKDDGPGAIDHQERTGERREYLHYFIPANEEYAEEDYARAVAYMRDEWSLIGFRVTVYLRGVPLGEASLWGVESDINSAYFEEIKSDLAEEAMREAEEKLKELVHVAKEIIED